MTSKIINRIRFISSNAFRQVLMSIFGIFIPFLVIHYSSKIVWGEFISFLLYILFTQQIINWGNKEHLIRVFSENPSKIRENFTSSLIIRLPILILFTIIDFSYFQMDLGLYLFLWQLGLFFVNSPESLIIYEKKFIQSIYIETLSFVFFLSCFYFQISQINVKKIVLIYSLYQLIKSILYVLLFKKTYILKNLKIDISYFKKNIWFFFLSILGFMISKIDVYIIESFHNKIITSDYQIMNTLLLFTMSIPMYIYTPFIKNIYRNNTVVIHKVKKTFLLLGLTLIPLALICISILQLHFLNNNYSLWTYIIAFFYVFPSFIYGIEILSLFKNHKEKTVVIVLFIGAIFNFILTYTLLCYNFNLNSALLGSAITQILILLLFSIIKKES